MALSTDLVVPRQRNSREPYLRAAGIKTPVTWTERKHSKSVWTRLERAYTSRGLKF